ncbi:hypothetical protein ANCCEY_04144 [Ancylostoma ceylanicum]|uniref:Uncharacterized protein n=1 Tax=Ancylostoma ceylanicum TaxID=53326 RepID=A0A0D6MA52_9BILA|nr:hypothetical protein ANCCEY_04144 [Ancylostoma ceylanicum]
MPLQKNATHVATVDSKMVQVANVSTTVDPYETSKPSSSNPGSITSYSSSSPPEPVYRIPAIVRNDNYQQSVQFGAYGNNPASLDFHTNAQMILKAKIDVLFDMAILARVAYIWQEWNLFVRNYLFKQ